MRTKRHIAARAPLSRRPQGMDDLGIEPDAGHRVGLGDAAFFNGVGVCQLLPALIAVTGKLHRRSFIDLIEAVTESLVPDCAFPARPAGFFLFVCSASTSF